MYAGMDPAVKRFWSSGSQHSLATSSTSSSSSSSSSSTLATELVPYIVRILAPELRGVNIQLMKPTDRAVVDRCVALMASHGISFNQERMEDGHYAMVLTP